MNITNVVINQLLPTKTGTSKAGNAYVIKEAIIGLPSDSQYPQTMLVKTMSQDVINQLEGAGIGATLASIDVDFYTNEYNGRHYQENRLWRIGTTMVTEQPAVAAQVPAPAPAETGELPF